MFQKLFSKRESAQISKQSFRSSLSNTDNELVQRLKIEKVLEPSHEGCVNTVSFSPDGQYIISGSDDLNLNIYNTYSGEMLTQIHTEHSNNIFGAKFMPCGNNSHIVSCAADGSTYLTIIGEAGDVRSSKKLGHQGRVHCIAIEPGSQHCVYSAGEDGSVCQYDVRSPHHCWPIINFSTVPELQYSLYSMSFNPMMPQQFVLGGEQWWIPVYDVRRNWHNDAQNEQPRLASPILQHYPNQLQDEEGMRVTSVIWSKQGYILASYNDGDIYLFDPNSTKEDCRIKTQPWQTTLSPTQSPSQSSTHSMSESEDDLFDDVQISPTNSDHNDDNLENNANTDNIDVFETGQNSEKGEQITGNSNSNFDDNNCDENVKKATFGDDFVEEEEEDVERLKETDNRRWSYVVQKFGIHRNRDTIKRVNFCGANDEYVMSGSDCGNLFVWDIKSGDLVFYDRADENIMNSLEQHPHMPFTIATSGLESSVKLWSPSRPEKKIPHVDELKRLYQRNKLGQQMQFVFNNEIDLFWREYNTAPECRYQ